MKRQREADEADDPVMANLQRGASTSSKKKANSQSRKLPIEVAALLGEAHADVISGREERAISILGEVVRRSPEDPEAYGTLSAVYEGKGDRVSLGRAQQLALVAAHLAPQDAAAWRRVAMLSLELAGSSSSSSSSATYEQSATEALARVLKLEPRDAAAAADRAALRAASGKVDGAVDELVSFLDAGGRRGDDRPAATVDDVALELVLAENALVAGRRDVARGALKRAVADATRALSRREEPEDADAPDVDPATMAESRDRASLELATLEYGERRWTEALAAVDAAAEGRDGEEPLDLVVLRGACNARLGFFDRAFECWRPLVVSARRLTSSSDDDEGLEELRRDHADMLESCIDASADAPSTHQVSVLSLLDSLSKLHRAAGLPRQEARAHARAATQLRKEGKFRVARQRVDRALRAFPGHPLALAELAELDVESDVLRTAFQSLELRAVQRFEEEQGEAAEGEEEVDDETGDDELAAWCSMGRAIAQKLASSSSESLQQQRRALATRLLAIGLPLARHSCGGSVAETAALALGKAAVDVVFLVRGKEPFASAASAMKAEGTKEDSAIESRMKRLLATYAKKGATKENEDVDDRVRNTFAKCYEWCAQSLISSEGYSTAAVDTLKDVALVCDLAPSLSPLSPRDVSRIASQFGLDSFFASSKSDDETTDPVRRLAAAAAAVACAPKDDCARRVEELTVSLRCLKKSPLPGARGRLAQEAVERVERAVLETPQKSTSPELCVLAASVNPDPRSALVQLERLETQHSATTAAAAALVRSAAFADSAASKPLPRTTIENRHGLALAAAAAFDEYAANRRQRPSRAAASDVSTARDAEVTYNQARLYHSLGLYSLAEPHYRAVLAHSEATVVLRRVAAHNLLAMLHSDGGFVDTAARDLVKTHLSLGAVTCS